MNKPNIKNEEKALQGKIGRREKKKHPLMKVDGGKLKNLQKIIRNKS